MLFAFGQRILVWIAIFLISLSLGQGLHYLPPPAQLQVAKFYVERIDPWLAKKLGVGSTVPTAGAPSPAITEWKPFVARGAYEFFCLPAGSISDAIGAKEADWTTVGHLVWGPASVALIVTLLWPKSRKETPQNIAARESLSPDKRDEIAYGNVTVQKLLDSELEMRLRARGARTALWYALLSGAATVLVRPSGTGSITLVSAHMAALAFAAVLAAIVAGHTFAARKHSVSIERIAVRVAFAGVFFGGLIALAISMPYQFARAQANGVAALDRFSMIAIARLFVLPTVAAAGCYAWIAVVRFFTGSSLIVPPLLEPGY